ncbi:MAG: fasciclin domain-containing protein [Acaryochloridaceae cyanobacterium CSU_5_19]|nr:fasciclin domain-containing protein [Acaryochloridaceae cyanobacterium CSU_5_19]
MKILCEHFPLNSRCTGDSAVTPAPAETGVESEPAAEEVSPEAGEETPETSAAEENIVEIASANDSFKTLVAALTAADLVETLSGDGPFTVFAPTDDAFAALPPGTVETLLKPENKDKLVKVLTYHVLATKAVSSDLQSGDVDTVANQPLKVMVDNDAVMVNDAQVVQADIMGSNGIIHAIDKVLLPPACKYLHS